MANGSALTTVGNFNEITRIKNLQITLIMKALPSLSPIKLITEVLNDLEKERLYGQENAFSIHSSMHRKFCQFLFQPFLGAVITFFLYTLSHLAYHT